MEKSLKKDQFTKIQGCSLEVHLTKWEMDERSKGCQLFIWPNKSTKFLLGMWKIGNWGNKIPENHKKKKNVKP